MADANRTRRRIGRFEYDPVVGTYILAVVVLGAVVLGALAVNHQGSPRMDDKAKLEQGVTIPNPSTLSPAQTAPQR